MKRKMAVKAGFWQLILAAVGFALTACAPAQQLPATGANRVEVQEEESTISMPTSIPARQTVLVYFLEDLELLAASLDARHPDRYRAMLERLKDIIETRLHKGTWKDGLEFASPVRKDYWS